MEKESQQLPRQEYLLPKEEDKEIGSDLLSQRKKKLKRVYNFARNGLPS